MALEDLKKDPMMSYLLDALHDGKDIGHYGRLVFVMVGRHFLPAEELIRLMMQDPDCDEAKARSLVDQVLQHRYNPPRRERILEWSKRQEFPLCPHSDDPDACNVYKNLEFSDETYGNIAEYREEKIHAAEP